MPLLNDISKTALGTSISTTTTLVGSAVAGGVGCFFAPASALAVGGMGYVVGACALGSLITCVPAGLVMMVPTWIFNWGVNTDSLLLMGLGVMTALAVAVTTVCLSAKIGATLLGLSAQPLLVCSLAGLAAMIGGALALTGLFFAIKELPWSSYLEDIQEALSCDF